MQFHIVNIEPQGFRCGHFLDYYCKLICYGLESLGHDCSIGCNQLDPQRMNILMGGHLLHSPADVEAIGSRGPYIVVQSEIIRPDGINLLRNTQTLQEVYLPLLMGAHAVWEGIPGNVPILRDYGIGACLILSGYHPRLEEIVPKRSRDVDFAFFGSTTPHRAELLQALQLRGYRVRVIFDARHLYRDDLLARTKVHLAPHQGGDMNHLPYGRVCFLLNNRGLVAVEECTDQAWLQDCFPSAPTHEWLDLCEELLHRKDRDAVADMYFEKYRQRPFTTYLQQVLDDTFPTSAAAHSTNLQGGLTSEQAPLSAKSVSS